MEYVLSFVAFVIVGGALGWWLAFHGQVFVIRIRDSVPVAIRGRVLPGFIADLGDVLDRHKVRTGCVRGLKRDGRVTLRFSRSIPNACRQGIRNVWAMHTR